MQDSGFKKKDRLTTNIPQEQFVYTRGGEHKVMKKVVNSVLASALALTVAPMAFAEEATQAPAMDANMEKTVKRLEALGLVAGYGNGDYGVDKTITRAEFATLIVRARGLEQGAKLAQFQSTFTDVRTTDWFSGFVNVASGQDIVKGFPDKSFKPQNQVTYAEAVTMIVRALGYEPAVRGDFWPNNFIAKASELNIAKNIAAPNNAATRGEVFKMLDNALRVKLLDQIEFGTDIRFEYSKETLLTKYLKVTVRDMDWVNDEKLDGEDLPFVTNVPVIGLGTLKANEITLSGKAAGLGSSMTYKVADGINPNEFAGQHVQVWIKDDAPSTIVWMEGSADEDVIMDRLGDFYLDGTNIKNDGSKLSKDSDIKKLKLELDGSGKTYKFSEDVKVTYNFHTYDSLEALQDIITDTDGFAFSAKLVLNNDNEISYIHVIDDQTMNKSVKEVKYGSKMIEKIDADKKKIYNLDDKSFGELEDLEEGEDFLVFLDNKPSKLSELQPMDVYNVYYAGGDDDKLLVFATRNVVEGKVEKITMKSATDNRLVIDGKTYRFRLDHSTYSDNGNKDIEDITKNNQDTIKDLDGEEVKLYLDASGRIRHIETADAITDRRFKATVSKQALYSGGDFNFQVVSESGKKVDITIDPKDIKGTDGKQYPEDNVEEDFAPDKENPLLLEVTLDAKGEAEKVKVLPTKLYKSSGNAWLDNADEDEDILKHNGKGYEVTSDTAIFDLTSEIEGSKRKTLKKPGIAKFSKIADQRNTSVLYTLNEDDLEVDAIFVIEGKSASSDMQYGQIVQYDRSGGKHTMKVVTVVDKEVKEVEYTLDDKSSELTDRGIKTGDFIAFSLNGSDEVVVDEVVEVVDAADDIESLKLLDEDDYSDAEIYDISAAIATKIDGNKITYVAKDEDGKKLGERDYIVRSNTAYFNAYDIEPGDKVEEGDYIVLFSTEDVASRYDYVLFINSKKDVEREDLETEGFLAQAKYDEDGNGGGDDDITPDLKVDSLAWSGVDKLGGLMKEFSVTGTAVKGAEVEVTIGKQSKTVTADDKGKFTVEGILGKADVTDAVITVTVGKESKEYEVTIELED
ncbi:Middle cell wall protein [Brevibacillus panacihumi W25]|uniref:Middle cell wall protein n=1 Tax=Brevibacillus panacihumi W25 TaxID=1408254 RepID=V6M9T7_9BACL|nr:S-layer homology domain-containing protein [Brevibacillus panacihumi]EST55341.1 Middle cell wall protein [Brevibacillus panacihumi W25]